MEDRIGGDAILVCVSCCCCPTLLLALLSTIGTVDARDFLLDSCSRNDTEIRIGTLNGFSAPLAASRSRRRANEASRRICEADESPSLSSKKSLKREDALRLVTREAAEREIRVLPIALASRAIFCGIAEMNASERRVQDCFSPSVFVNVREE